MDDYNNTIELEDDNEVLDKDFEEQALAVMQDIGLPEDEAEAMLDDYLYMFGL